MRFNDTFAVVFNTNSPTLAVPLISIAVVDATETFSIAQFRLIAVTFAPIEISPIFEDV